MNCEPADPAQLAAEIRLAQAGTLYQAAPAATLALRLHISLPRQVGAGALFLVRSMRLDDWLYRGPWAPALTLRFDERLAADRGSDTLQFFLFDPAAGVVCAWLNERGEHYWVDGALVTVALLDEGAFGPDGLFQQHRVHIER